jgi:hypothetical protein
MIAATSRAPRPPHHDVTSAKNAERDISARFGRSVGARQSGSTTRRRSLRELWRA